MAANYAWATSDSYCIFSSRRLLKRRAKLPVPFFSFPGRSAGLFQRLFNARHSLRRRHSPLVAFAVILHSSEEMMRMGIADRVAKAHLVLRQVDCEFHESKGKRVGFRNLVRER